ncbi:hypothetical protein [uncultured Jannaschia sp.]|uniref:hypothetical protein n=1 Tax=uncultured Jannaschia sp. TaxID=293347 RepID=UPI002607F032|nr:hypothetical protein [uncultured Jannaschia sp.]
MVNFEKDVTIALFMVRKLDESGKFSSRIKKHRAAIFRSRSVKTITQMNYRNIEEVYDLTTEEKISKPISFVCNQFIHGGATFAYRREDRNWDGIYTCSDYERAKYIYRVPLSEVVALLELAVIDYPASIRMIFNPAKGDYDVETD